MSSGSVYYKGMEGCRKHEGLRERKGVVLESVKCRAKTETKLKLRRCRLQMWRNGRIVGLIVLSVGLLSAEFAFSQTQYNGYSGQYNQAPMLEELVQAGQLPPVEERLPIPEDVAVVQPVEQIGQYGGTWHRPIFGPADFHSYGRVIYDNIARFDEKGNVHPNIVKKWEVEEGGKVWYLYLRRGMKWSDGYPFTADDILFWWEDIANDPNITPAVPDYWVIGGEPMKVTKVDDYTVRLEFKEATGIVPILLAHTGPQWPNMFERWGFFAPKHYLKQFHPRYNPDATYELFEKKAQEFNPDLPVVTAWKVVSWEPGIRLVAERNPYYWKVDPEGNQLPYIDRVILDVIADKETVQLKAMAGEYEMQARHIDPTQLPAFKQHEGEGGYTVRLWDAIWAGNPTLFFNHNTTDPVKKELFNNLKFKQALSYAINRDRINEVVFLGLATPRQNNMVPMSPYYDPELDTIYTEYDPALANRLLDEIGLTERDADGYRLGPDGNPLTLAIDVSLPAWPGFMDALEMVTEDWRRIGIHAVLNPVERAKFFARVNANEQDIGTWQTDEALVSVTFPWWIPTHPHSMMAPMYAQWVVSGGKSGWEPKGDFKVALDLLQEYRTTVDPKKQAELMKRILDIHIRKNLWTIGTVGLNKVPVIVKNNFHNVPEHGVCDWLLRTPGYTHPEQYFIAPQQGD